STAAGPRLSAPGGLALPPLLLGSSGFALEIAGLTLTTAPFDVGISQATLHFPKSLHALAKSVQVADAHMNDAGFSGTIGWTPAPGGAVVPLPGDLGDTLHLRVTEASVTFVDSTFASGRFTVDFDDLEVPIPGLDGTALVIGAGTGLQVDLTGSTDGIGVALRGITAALKVSPDILRPVTASGDPDPAVPAVLRAIRTLDAPLGPDGP